AAGLAPAACPTRRSSDLSASQPGDCPRERVVARGSSRALGLEDRLREHEDAAVDGGIVDVLAERDGSIAADVHARSLAPGLVVRSEEHTSELQSRGHLVC